MAVGLLAGLLMVSPLALLPATAGADDLTAQSTGAGTDPSFDNGWGYDPRGDITTQAADFSGGLITVALTTRSFDNPQSSYNWRAYQLGDPGWFGPTGIVFGIDVNGDSNDDYTVFYLSDGSNVRAQVTPAGSSGTVLCSANPYWDASSNFYSAWFSASCIGSPSRIWLNSYMRYETSSTISEDDTSWLGPVDNRSAAPIGSLDNASIGPGGIAVSGWALDPDTTGSINVHVYVDGSAAGVLTANTSRPDIGAAYPGYGSGHGFAGTVGTAPGDHRVCVYAINNASPGDNTLLRCTTVRVPSGNPIGSLDSTSGQILNRIRVAGWALDPNSSATVDVHIYVDGAGVAVLSANQSRPDVGSIYPAFGSQHGFSGDVPASGGTHQVCAYAINIGAGGNSLIGCRTATVPANPIGSIDSLSVGSGLIRVQGWALDPNVTNPITVHFYAGNQLVGTAYADRSRPDIAAAFPGLGENHGFDGTFSVPPGQKTICAYGINIGAGGNSLIGCVTANVPPGDPFGNLDVAERVGGQIRVAGWALDPDTSASINVHVYMDGAFLTSGTASNDRPDVGSAYPSNGSAHGFDLSASAAAGSHTICVYAINVGAGGNSLIACRSV